MSNELPAVARAAVQVGDRTYEVQEFPVPAIGADDALLRVEASGMCGSDISQYKGGFAALGVEYPLIPGHEPIGTIAAIGPKAERRWGVTVGDRVVVEPVLGCGMCRACLLGDYRRCGAGAIHAYGYLPTTLEPSLWGGYAEYMYLAPRSVLHRIDPDLPIELAALYQPMAAGVRWAAHDSTMKLGDTVLILGCGQRGLASVVAAREAGAGRVIVTGLAQDAHKLELARRFGADQVIVADEQSTTEAVMDYTSGRGVDVAVDLTSAMQPIVDAVDVIRPGGTVVLAGVKGSGRAVDGLTPDKLVQNEITLKGMWSQDLRAFEPALRLIESRKYPLELMHTHKFTIDQVPQAIETLAGDIPGEEATHIIVMP